MAAIMLIDPENHFEHKNTQIAVETIKKKIISQVCPFKFPLSLAQHSTAFVLHTYM